MVDILARHDLQRLDKGTFLQAFVPERGRVS